MRIHCGKFLSATSADYDAAVRACSCVMFLTRIIRVYSCAASGRIRVLRAARPRRGAAVVTRLARHRLRPCRGDTAVCCREATRRSQAFVVARSARGRASAHSTLQLQLHTPTQIPPSNSNSILQLQALWLTFVCFRVPRRRFSCLAGMQARRAEPATWRRARRSLKPGSKATVQIALARLHPRQVRGRAPAHSTLQLQLHTPTPSIMADFRELARPRKDTKRGLDV